jgi:ADP-ribosylglycohydrolase
MSTNGSCSLNKQERKGGDMSAIFRWLFNCPRETQLLTKEVKATESVSKWDCVMGAAVGDMWGSSYEYYETNGQLVKWHDPSRIMPTSSSHITDDTLMTLACYEAASGNKDYKAAYLKYARAIPDVGYGGMFYKWFNSDDPQPYNSFGNGSAMRVSPIGWLFDDEAAVLEEAKQSALPTHNHPEGIKGAQAVALAVFLLRNGATKQQLKERIEKDFGYDLSRTIDEIRPTHTFDVTCQGTVPVAMIAFFESKDYTSAVQNAISVGGDTDTLGAIAGSIAAAAYGTITFPSVPMHGTMLALQAVEEVIANKV